MAIDLATDKAKDQYHQVTLQLLSRLEGHFVKNFSKKINKQYRKIAQLVKQGIHDIDPVIDQEVIPMKTFLRIHYRRVSVIAGKNFISNLKSEQIENFWSIADRYIALYAANKITKIQDTTKTIISKIIQKAVAEGKTNAEIAKELRRFGLIDSRFRAIRIARTETLSIYNYATDQVAKNTGIKFEREWHTTKDLRTRRRKKGSPFDHWVVDGQKRGQDEPFDVSGEALMFPGDPRGSAGNIVNCLHPLSIINFASPNKLIRRWYKGIMLRIETHGGHKLTITPNHPILGKNGWIPAYFLKKGDSIIGCDLLDIKTFNFNVKNIDVPIEKIFNFFSTTLKKVRSGSAIMNFHGEITNQDIDIIEFNNSLRNSRIISFFDPFKEFFFPFTNKFFINRFGNSSFSHRFGIFYRFNVTNFNKFFVSLFSLIQSLFLTHLGPFKSFRLALISGGYSINLKNPINSTSAKFNVFRNFINRHAIVKHIYHFFKSMFVSSDKNKFRTFRMVLSNIFKYGIQFSLRNTKDFLKFKWGNSFKVKLFDICNISHIDYSGYVYNLEDNKSYYICNGIAMHNCRCLLLYNQDRSLEKE